jgi:hypothetical protein
MSLGVERRNGVARPAGTPAVSPSTSTAVLPKLPGRRNPRWIALGIVALCLGALLSYVVYARVAAESTVVSVARTVYRGEVVERADLTSVRLSGGGLPGTVPVADLERLVGQRAVFDLPAGSVLVAGSVADTTVPADGRTAVGLRLAAGRAPQQLLLPGAPVRLVALAAPAAAAGVPDALAGKTYTARVIDQAPGADGASTLLDVEVDEAQAATIASLAAAERVAVVRDAGR